MKKIKKFLLTIAMTMIFSVSAFAASGFEFILNVPLGVGISIPDKDLKDAGFKGTAGFEAGVSAQLGYMFQVVNGFGISALVELGYAHDHFGTSIEGDLGTIGAGLGLGSGTVKVSESYALDSFQIGLLPKFNIGAFSIGIGGGVKVPLGGKYTMKIGDTKDSIKLTTADTLSMLTPPVIGYVKATFDYSIFFTEKLALNVGLYLGGDIAKQEVSVAGVTAKTTQSSFDVGVELGFKFGPKA